MGMKRSLAIARRVLLELFRTRRTLVFWVIFPTLMLILFGMIYSGRGSMGRGFDSTAPGILIGAALFFSCMAGPTALVVAERERRTLRRLLLSPLRSWEYFVGISLAHLAIAVMQAVVVYGIAYAFGGRFRGSMLLGTGIVVLSVISFVGIGFFFGSVFTKRTEDVNGPVSAFGVPLLVLGGTFFPVSILPMSLYSITWFNPIFHMNQALRGVSARAMTLAEVAPHVEFLLVFAIASLWLGVRSYRAMLVMERGS